MPRYCANPNCKKPGRRLHHRERHDICMWCLGGDHDPFQCPVCSTMEKKNLLKREEARQQFLATGVWPKYFHSKSSASAVSQASSSKVSKVSKVSKQTTISLDTSKKPVVTPKVVHTPKVTPKVTPKPVTSPSPVLGLEASLPLILLLCQSLQVGLEREY